MNGMKRPSALAALAERLTSRTAMRSVRQVRADSGLKVMRERRAWFVPLEVRALKQAKSSAADRWLSIGRASSHELL
jgi:hypothetical protein